MRTGRVTSAGLRTGGPRRRPTRGAALPVSPHSFTECMCLGNTTIARRDTRKGRSRRPLKLLSSALEKVYIYPRRGPAMRPMGMAACPAGLPAPRARAGRRLLRHICRARPAPLPVRTHMTCDMCMYRHEPHVIASIIMYARPRKEKRLDPTRARASCSVRVSGCVRHHSK